MKYDAFLSYNSKDHWAVEALANRLKGEPLRVYFDQWGMDPGCLVQPDLIAALTQSRCCVLFLGPHGLGPWQDLELQGAIKRLVEERRDLETGRETFRVVRILLPGFQLPPKDELATLGFLAPFPRVQFFRSIDDEHTFRRLVWGITGRKPHRDEARVDDGRRPYQGLHSFGPDQADFFFGASTSRAS